MTLRDGSVQRASGRRARATTVWIGSLVVLWTVAWMSMNVIHAKWELIVPMGLLAAGAVLTVGFGRTLGPRKVRGRINRMAQLATLALTAWSFAALIVSLLIYNVALGSIVSTVVFGSFVAVILALVCYFVLMGLLWLGTLLGPKTPRRPREHVHVRDELRDPSADRSESFRR